MGKRDSKSRRDSKVDHEETPKRQKIADALQLEKKIADCAGLLKVRYPGLFASPGSEEQAVELAKDHKGSFAACVDFVDCKSTTATNKNATVGVMFTQKSLVHTKKSCSHECPPVMSTQKNHSVGFLENAAFRTRRWQKKKKSLHTGRSQSDENGRS